MKVHVSTQIESHQAKEIKCQELEVAQHSLTVSHQQMEEMLAEMNSRLQEEQDSRILQESLYKEQAKMFELLRTESVKTQESKKELFAKLEISESSRQGGWLFWELGR